MEVNHRFKGFNWYKSKYSTTVQVLGLGGIGSYTTFLLLRAGVEVEAWDFDTVENHNIGCQFTEKNMLGKNKTEAINSLCAKLIPELNLYTNTSRFTESSYCYYQVFSCFDNHASRRLLFNKWKDTHQHNSSAIFIDGRIDGELLKIYCIRGEDYERMENYQATLDEDGLVMRGTTCTTEQTSHIGAMIGSFMVSFYLNHISNLEEEFNCREVPYSYTIFTPLMAITDVRN